MKLKKEQLIRGFKSVHKDKYDYSKVVYKNMHSKITIICKEHGEFNQRASDHKYGNGCAKCSIESKTLTEEQIIKDFKEVHKDKYDYSKVVYINTKTKVKIICKDHGIFEQNPKGHKRGQACPKCANKNNSINNRSPIHGIGINDADYTTSWIDKNGKTQQCPYYTKWRNMINRCYDKKAHKKHPTYKDCYVVKEWHTFSIFKAWMEVQDWEGKELDKDLLYRRNRQYSKERCCFVSRDINNVIKEFKVVGDLPLGVRTMENSSKYVATVRKYGKKIHLGYFYTVEEASDVYNKAKSEYMLELAKDVKDIRVYASLKRRSKIKKETLNHLTKAA